MCDSSGIEIGTSFRDWAEEWPDWDSPADAWEAFEACKVAARFLNRALGSKLEALREWAHER